MLRGGPSGFCPSDREPRSRLYRVWDEIHAIAPESAYGRTLVELTTRTIQGRYLLRPSGALNQITVGIIARAQKLSGAEVHAFVCLSNHLQLVASFLDVQQMSTFTQYLNGNLAREANRLHDWQSVLEVRPERQFRVPIDVSETHLRRREASRPDFEAGLRLLNADRRHQNLFPLWLPDTLNQRLLLS